MFYELVQFSDYFGPLNVFRYITFRTGGAIMTALLFVFLFGPAMIDFRFAGAPGQRSAYSRRRPASATSSKSKARRPWAGLMILFGMHRLRAVVGQSGQMSMCGTVSAA